MRLFLKSSLVLIVYFFTFVNLYSAEAPTGLKVDNFSSDSVDLSWSEVEGAEGYMIYYSKTSGENGDYDFIFGDEIEINNNGSVSGLDQSTNYYFAVTSIDDEGIESGYSSEVSVTTTDGSSNQNTFALELIEVIDFNVIRLDFNSNLDTSSNASRELKIVNRDDFLDELDIETSEVKEGEPKSLYVTLLPFPELDVEYEVTVIDIVDEEGRNIESGVDGLDSFTVSSSFIPKDNEEDLNNNQEQEFNSADESENNIQDNNSSDTNGESIIEPQDNSDNGVTNSDEEINNSDFNSAGAEENESLAGQNVEGTENVESASKDNEKLPETGPEIFLLLLLALVLGLISYRYKKA